MIINNQNITLLVLDIDETLIYSTKEKLDREPDFKIENYFVYKRPYLDEFIDQINKSYKIGIWSSASDDYVTEIVKQIIPSSIQLEFIWGRSRCVYRRNFHRDEKRYVSTNHSSHYNYIKPLKKLKRKGFKLDRILIIDDTPHKSQDNYGNAIYPSEYKGNLNDNELIQLSKYLDTLKDKTDVRNIEKRTWRDIAKKKK